MPGRRDVTATPAALAEIGSAVAARIDTLLAAETARWTAVDPVMQEPLEYLRDLVHAGGKRLRPAFCYWAFVGAGGSPDDAAVVDAGAALELLHTFALIHDDVMDGSATRRGTAAVHAHFERRHEAEGLRGEGRRFGEGVAILVGDLTFVYADQLLAGASREAWEVFDELRLEVNVGQYLDLVATARADHSRSTAERIARYKSAKYTVERPLHLGAALAESLGRLQEPLTAFGVPLGDAFQLRDDLLGAFGDPDAIGKPVGDDLREGKPTALIALARERGDAGQVRLLDERLGRRDLTQSDVAEIQAVLVETGAREEVERQVKLLVEEALAALRTIEITPEARDRLAELAEFVAGRDH